MPKMCFNMNKDSYDLCIISILKCKEFEMYLKSTYSSSTLAQANIHQYIFSVSHSFTSASISLSPITLYLL